VRSRRAASLRSGAAVGPARRDSSDGPAKSLPREPLGVFVQIALREDVELRHIATALLDTVEFLEPVTEHDGIIPVRRLEVPPVAPLTDHAVIEDALAVGDEVAVLRTLGF